jgi:hypothetical protein
LIAIPAAPLTSGAAIILSPSNCWLREAWGYVIKGKMQPSPLLASIYCGNGLCTGDHREVHTSAAVFDSMF